MVNKNTYIPLKKILKKRKNKKMKERNVFKIYERMHQKHFLK